jgi:hypothetical protein
MKEFRTSSTTEAKKLYAHYYDTRPMPADGDEIDDVKVAKPGTARS